MLKYISKGDVSPFIYSLGIFPPGSTIPFLTDLVRSHVELRCALTRWPEGVPSQPGAVIIPR
jgi:hypothetical protein